MLPIEIIFAVVFLVYFGEIGRGVIVGFYQVPLLCHKGDVSEFVDKFLTGRVIQFIFEEWVCERPQRYEPPPAQCSLRQCYAYL